ncbi:isopentenyl transferase family protein [Streptomyces prunicolor]|uniref:isopentenyl transferase family protein n=1 Tax=Streptomyces prunicolor TaxID=67348 RepID=UPI0037D3A2A5
MSWIGSPVPLSVHLIAGPTGVGKSARASELARSTGAPVVVADRIQCFTELATTSARAGADTPGVRRVWLCDRSVSEGDYPATEAVESLVEKIAELGLSAPSVIIEGGSISLLTLFVRRLPELPWHITTQLLTRPPDMALYLKALTVRAHAMLHPAAPQRSLLEELAGLWADPANRWFAASVNGFEAALEWCAKHSLDPESSAIENLPKELLAELENMIAVRHAEHGGDQETAFRRAFSAHPSATASRSS